MYSKVTWEEVVTHLQLYKWIKYLLLSNLWDAMSEADIGIHLNVIPPPPITKHILSIRLALVCHQFVSIHKVSLHFQVISANYQHREVLRYVRLLCCYVFCCNNITKCAFTFTPCLKLLSLF